MASVAAVIVVAGTGAGFFFFSKDNSKNNQNNGTDTSALPESMKQAIQADLNISPQEFMAQAKVGAELDNFKLDIKADIKKDVAGVYISASGTPTINVTSEATKKLLEEAKQSPDQVSNDAREAIREAQQSIKTAADSTSVLDAKTAIDNLMQKAQITGGVSVADAQSAVDAAKKALDAAIEKATTSEGKQFMIEAKVQIGSIDVTKLATDAVKSVISLAQQAVSKAVSIGTEVATTALGVAKQVLSQATGGIASEKVVASVEKVSQAIDNALKNVTSGDLIGLVTQGITDVTGIVSSIIDIPLDTQINVVGSSSLSLSANAEEAKQLVSTLPDEIKSKVVGISKDVASNSVNLILQQAKDASSQISLPQNLGNVSVVEVRTDISVGQSSPITLSGSVTAGQGNSAQANVSMSTDGKVAGGSGFGIKVGDKDLFYCSTGFNATDTQGNPVVLTAGQCQAGTAQASGTFMIDGSKITDIPALQFTQSKIGDSPAVDVAIAKPAGDAERFANAEVRTGENQTVQITGSVDPVPGMPVCKFGQTTGFTCGRVFLGSMSFPLNGTADAKSWTSDMYLTNVCTRDGDNGGAYISGTLAVGTASGGPSANLSGSAQAPCIGDSLLDQLVGNWSLITPVSDYLEAFPGTKLNTVANS